MSMTSIYFERLKRLAARLMGRRGPLFGPSQDPYARVREPRRRGPAGRQSAIAVMEPEPDESIDVAGRVR
jgi:hypothetical protein